MWHTAAFFVFSATGAAKKLLISENRSTSDFQGRVVGIGGSRVQSENPTDFRRVAFPPRECRLYRHSQASIVETFIIVSSRTSSNTLTVSIEVSTVTLFSTAHWRMA